VFVDGWTVPAAAEVAGLEEERALELSEALARPAWPHLRRVEAALVAHVRHTLGAARSIRRSPPAPGSPSGTR
jgi:hypothetical protein